MKDEAIIRSVLHRFNFQRLRDTLSFLFITDKNLFMKDLAMWYVYYKKTRLEKRTTLCKKALWYAGRFQYWLEINFRCHVHAVVDPMPTRSYNISGTCLRIAEGLLMWKVLGTYLKKCQYHLDRFNWHFMNCERLSRLTFNPVTALINTIPYPRKINCSVYGVGAPF